MHRNNAPLVTFYGVKNFFQSIWSVSIINYYCEWLSFVHDIHAPFYVFE